MANQSKLVKITKMYLALTFFQKVTLASRELWLKIIKILCYLFITHCLWNRSCDTSLRTILLIWLFMILFRNLPISDCSKSRKSKCSGMYLLAVLSPLLATQLKTTELQFSLIKYQTFRHLLEIRQTFLLWLEITLLYGSFVKVQSHYILP